MHATSRCSTPNPCVRRNLWAYTKAHPRHITGVTHKTYSPRDAVRLSRREISWSLDPHGL
jgi:hypothetical protein